MTRKILQIIRTANAQSLEPILKALLSRYAEVFPQWEISVITLDKQKDRNDQIDAVIAVLENMKS